MEIYKTAEEAINTSRELDTITHCSDTKENVDFLKRESDDWTEDSGYDFWADDPETGGMEWRVKTMDRG